MPRAPRVTTSIGPSVVFISAIARRMLDSDNVVSAAIWEFDTASDSLSRRAILSWMTESTVHLVADRWAASCNHFTADAGPLYYGRNARCPRGDASGPGVRSLSIARPLDRRSLSGLSLRRHFLGAVSHPTRDRDPGRSAAARPPTRPRAAASVHGSDSRSPSACPPAVAVLRPIQSR